MCLLISAVVLIHTRSYYPNYLSRQRIISRALRVFLAVEIPNFPTLHQTLEEMTPVFDSLATQGDPTFAESPRIFRYVRSQPAAGYGLLAVSSQSLRHSTSPWREEFSNQGGIVQDLPATTMLTANDKLRGN